MQLRSLSEDLVWKNTLLPSRIRLQALAAYEVGGGTILSPA